MFNSTSMKQSHPFGPPPSQNIELNQRNTHGEHAKSIDNLENEERIKPFSYFAQACKPIKIYLDDTIEEEINDQLINSQSSHNQSSATGKQLEIKSDGLSSERQQFDSGNYMNTNNTSRFGRQTLKAKNPLYLRPDQIPNQNINSQNLKSEDWKKQYTDLNKLGNDYFINYFHPDEEKQLRFKIMICVTVYNETRAQLEGTLKGILKSIPEFTKHNILPQEIGVFVIFDGIAKINDNQEEQDTQNMIKFIQMLENSQLTNFSSDQNKELSIGTQRKQYITDVEVIEKLKDIIRKLNEKNLDENQKILSDLREKLVKLEKKFKEDYHKKALLHQVYYFPNELNRSTDVDSLCRQEQDYNSVKYTNREDFTKFVEMSALNLFLCIKYENNQKLSSHQFFFNGFCQYLNPDYCILMDCGLKPKTNAIWEFFITMETNPDIGGVCGFMSLEEERNFTDSGKNTEDYDFDPSKVDCLTIMCETVFPIQKAQYFEYYMGHMIDKNFESFFGYIHVLPGAFSAYRWKSLNSTLPPDKDQKQPKYIIDEYLRPILKKDEFAKTQDISIANMYLAEDRILGYRLYTNNENRNVLQYCPSAKADVDSMKTLPGLMGQRKRWINGSWFALNYVLKNTSFFHQRNHGSLCYKILDIIKFYSLMLYSLITQCLLYFILTIYFTTISILLRESINDDDNIEINGKYYSLQFLSTLAQMVYMLFVLTLFYLSLTTTVKNPIATQYVMIYDKISFITYYYGISTVLGILVFASFIGIMYAIVIILLFGHLDSLDQSIAPKWLVLASIYITLGGHTVPLLLDISNYSKSIRTIKSIFSFIFYSPTYIHIFVIYVKLLYIKLVQQAQLLIILYSFFYLYKFTYAFCRIDDLSWGTKGQDKQVSQNQFKHDKVVFVTKWFFFNTFFGYLAHFFIQNKQTKSAIIIFIAVLAASIVLLRAVFSSLHLI